MGFTGALISESFAGEDRSWIKARKGLDTMRSITLDLSTFIAGTHYPNGYLPSGLVLGVVTATGRYAPYSDAATWGAGTDVARGFLFNTTYVHDAAGRVSAPLFWEGIVNTNRLPLNHGLTTAARADLIHIRFEP